MEILKAFLTGSVVGIIFAALDLPTPAPTAFAGIVGIFGIWFGLVIVKYFSGF